MVWVKLSDDDIYFGTHYLKYIYKMLAFIRGVGRDKRMGGKIFAGLFAENRVNIDCYVN